MKKRRLMALFLLFQAVAIAGHAQKQFKALLVTTTKGWHHESLHYGVVALNELAERNEFQLTLMQDPKFFTDKNLQSFHVVIFLNTTGDIFDSTQQKVMERFIQSGKGFVGIHSASDTEYDWAWYTRLVGRMFASHPPTQTARLQVVDSSFPGVQHFNNKLWTDEWYEFGPEKVAGLNYVLAVDEASYTVTKKTESKGGGMGEFHPVAWYHNFDGGRSFYTALGHVPAIYKEAAFLDHVYAGIVWAATGRK